MIPTTMLRQISATLGCACLLLLPAQAQTTDDVAPEGSDSFYLRLSAGPQHRARASDSAGSTTFKTGYVFDAAIGYLANSHHIEAELSSFNNRCNTTDPAGDAIGVEPSSGNVDVDAIMANYAYDISLGAEWAQLYVGGGIGLCQVSINGLTTPSLRTLPAEWGGPIVVYAKSDWTTAYQFRIGVKFTPRPRIDVLLGYRLLESSTLDINLADGSTIHPDARIHAFEVSVRLKF